MKLIKLIMSSQGDMEIVEQDSGSILLRPTYFGGECAGPILQILDRGEPVKGEGDQETYQPADVVEASYRIRIRKDGEPRIAKAD